MTASPDIGGVVVLRPGEEVGLHDLLGVVRRDLPEAGVRLVTALGQLEVKVSTAAVHLEDLDGVGVRVVDLYHGTVAGVEWEFHSDQRFNPVRVGSPGPHHVVPEAAGTGVDVESVLHQAGLPTQEHHVEGCVPPGRDDLKVASSAGFQTVDVLTLSSKKEQWKWMVLPDIDSICMLL